MLFPYHLPDPTQHYIHLQHPAPLPPVQEVTDLQHRLIGLGHLSSSATFGTWTADIPSALETMLDRLGYISHSETLSLHGLEARQVQVRGAEYEGCARSKATKCRNF